MYSSHLLYININFIYKKYKNIKILIVKLLIKKFNEFTIYKPLLFIK